MLTRAIYDTPIIDKDVQISPVLGRFRRSKVLKVQNKLTENEECLKIKNKFNNALVSNSLTSLKMVQPEVSPLSSQNKSFKSSRKLDKENRVPVNKNNVTKTLSPSINQSTNNNESVILKRKGLAPLKPNYSEMISEISSKVNESTQNTNNVTSSQSKVTPMEESVENNSRDLSSMRRSFRISKKKDTEKDMNSTQTSSNCDNNKTKEEKPRNQLVNPKTLNLRSSKMSSIQLPRNSKNTNEQNIPNTTPSCTNQPKEVIPKNNLGNQKSLNLRSSSRISVQPQGHSETATAKMIPKTTAQKTNKSKEATLSKQLANQKSLNLRSTSRISVQLSKSKTTKDPKTPEATSLRTNKPEVTPQKQLTNQKLRSSSRISVQPHNKSETTKDQVTKDSKTPRTTPSRTNKSEEMTPRHPSTTQRSLRSRSASRTSIQPHKKSETTKHSRTPETTSSRINKPEDSNQKREHIKTPIWIKIKEPNYPLFNFKSKRKSARVSNASNKDVYDFKFEPSNENKVTQKKRKRKAWVRKKKLTSSIKSSLLTTDPSWQPPLKNVKTKMILPPSLYKPKQSKKLGESDSRNEDDNTGNDDFDSHFDDIAGDDAGYEASASVDETNSVCLFSANNLQSVMPTPNINARFPGTSSTPRVDDNERLFSNFLIGHQKPLDMKDEVKVCFGFDDESEDSNLGLSPVKKTSDLSQLHAASLCIFSNVEEIEPIPTRFAVPYLNRRGVTQTKFKSSLDISNKRRNNRATSKQNLKSQNLTNDKENVSQCKHNTKEILQNTSLFDMVEEEPNCENRDLRLTNLVSMEHISSLTLPPTESHSITPLNTRSAFSQNILPSPEKSFSQPPRRSYNRESLEAVKRKFHEAYAGGYPTTETETEAEEAVEPNTKLVTRRKRKKIVAPPTKGSSQHPLQPKKTYPKKTKRKENSENKVPPSGDEGRPRKKRAGATRRQGSTDKSAFDWASDLNSHFSEIDDLDLVVE